MSITSDWDIDYYKTDYESDEHWELRRSFMDKHKDKFPEDELVCLAQVFTNVEFMGCKYPEETMRKVGLLSQEVANDFRKSREKKLKRTFVEASDAAGAKAKRGNISNSANPQSNINKYMKPVQFISSQSAQSPEPVQPLSEPQPQKKPITVNKLKYMKLDDMPTTSVTHKTTSGPSHQQTKRQHQYKLIVQNQYKNLILFDPGTDTYAPDQKSFQILSTSANKQKGSVKATYENVNGQSKCTLEINGIAVAEAVGEDKKISRTMASDLAMKKLRKVCYIIKQKEKSKPSIQINSRCGKDESHKTLLKSASEAFVENKLTDQNKGFKMMKHLGWTGGALGTGGILEPVSVQLKVDRKGLGLDLMEQNNDSLNRKYFANYLTKYRLDADNIHELVFSTEYTKEERATLHSIAARQGLKSQSKNTNDGERYLIISKKIPMFTLAQNILNNGIYADVYDIISPEMSD